MEMTVVPESELHPNAVITELAYTTENSTTSVTPTRIETDSLVFTPIFEEDLSDVYELYSDLEAPGEVFAHYGTTRHMTQQETREYMEKRKQTWRDAEWCEYVITEKQSGELIGKTYYKIHSELMAAEIGIWLRKPYWGNSYSQERADALLHLAFNHLDFAFVNVGCVIQNEKSIRSIEKYIRRYNGTYYGNVPKMESAYHADVDDAKSVVEHPEWMVTEQQYRSHGTGISTNISGVAYDDVTLTE